MENYFGNYSGGDGLEFVGEDLGPACERKQKQEAILLVSGRGRRGGHKTLQEPKGKDCQKTRKFLGKELDEINKRPPSIGRRKRDASKIVKSRRFLTMGGGRMCS